MTGNHPKGNIRDEVAGLMLASLKARRLAAQQFIYNQELKFEVLMLDAQIEALTHQLWPIKNEGCWQPGKKYCLKDLAEHPVCMCPPCYEKHSKGERA